jgi:hypothetical protein
MVVSTRLDWILFFRDVAVAVAVARLVLFLLVAFLLALGFCALAVLLKGAVSFVYGLRLRYLTTITNDRI